MLDVAGELAFALRWVEQLAARYNAYGPEALGDRRRGNGRAASVLTPALVAALAKRLRIPPDDGGRWTSPEVGLWMAAHLGVERMRPQRGWEVHIIEHSRLPAALMQQQGGDSSPTEPPTTGTHRRRMSGDSKFFRAEFLCHAKRLMFGRRRLSHQSREGSGD